MSIHRGDIFTYLQRAGLEEDVLVEFADPSEVAEIIKSDNWQEVTSLDLNPGVINELKGRLSKHLNEDDRKEVFTAEAGNTDQNAGGDPIFGTWNTSTVTEKNLELDQQQKRLIQKEFDGPGLINGVPGSGKTTIAVHRLNKRFQKAVQSDKKQLFITYTNSLKNGSRDLFSRLWQGDERRLPESIEFKTLNSWCTDFLKKVKDKSDISIVYPQPKRSYIEESVSEVEEHRKSNLFDRSYQFWEDEFDNVIYGMAEGEKSTYLDIERVGRGSSLGPKARETVWDVFKAYRRRLETKNLLDHSDVLLQAKDRLEEPGAVPDYEQIVVDEAQDFSVLELNVLTKLARASTASLIFFADAAQSIYQHGFTWKDTGYDIHSSDVHQLEKNYRTPEPINKAAKNILPPDEREDRVSTSMKEGQPPRLVWTGGRKKHHFEVLAHEILNLLEGSDTRLSDIAVLGNRKDDLTYAMEEFVEPEGINCRFHRNNLELDESTVKFITIQSSKGLQFDHVFLTRVDHDRYPDKAWRHFDIDDETIDVKSRKMLYVGMTRAMRQVTLLARKDYESDYIDELKQYCKVDHRTDL